MQHPPKLENDDELVDRDGAPRATGKANAEAQTPEVIVSSEAQDHQTTVAPPANNGGNNLIHGIQGIMSLSGNGSLADNVRNSFSTLARPKEKDRTVDMSELVPPSRVKKPLHLLNLPPEVQILIIRHLAFADIERLRRTCKYLRALANPATIRTIMGDSRLKNQLMGHCHACLLPDPFRSRLLLGRDTDPGWPLNNKCIDCALRSNDDRLRVGNKVRLASLVDVWICRWCGLPVAEGAASGNEQFHRPCYQSYNNVLVYFFLLGWLQLALGIIAAALAWRYWRHTPLVFGPTLASFFLLWVCVIFLIFRGNRIRTYHYTLVLELIILGLWVAPVYKIASDIADHPEEPVPKHTQAALAMFGLNMIFRLLNALGNIVLVFEYEITKAYRPTAALWRKIVNPVFAGLIYWTYPQALERRRPAKPDDLLV